MQHQHQHRVPRQDPTGSIAIDSGSSKRNSTSSSTINYQRYIVYFIILLFGTFICTYIGYFTIQKESSNNVVIIKNNNNNGNNGVTVKEEEVIYSKLSKSKGTTTTDDAQHPEMEEVGLEIQQEENTDEAYPATSPSPRNQTKKGNNNNKRNNNNINSNNNNNNNNKKKKNNNNAHQETKGDLEEVIEEEEANTETTTTTDDAEAAATGLQFKEEEVKEEIIKEEVVVAKQEKTKSSSVTTTPTTTKSQQEKNDGESSSLIKTTFDVEELCGNVPKPTSTPIDYEHKQFECGQKRLQDEYGISIVLDSIEVNPDTGVGSISISMCQPNCFHKFNASDILLWVRFRSSDEGSGVLFAIYPQPIDCRSWYGEFKLPVVIEGGGGSSLSYQVDVMTIWLHGHPNSWTSSNFKEYHQNTVWEGTRYNNKQYRIHWESINLARWMGCEDFCGEFKHCTHWSENKKAGPFVQSVGRCMMFTNVTGTSKSKGVISGYYPETEHRVNYLGGLAKWTSIKDERSACRELAHVLGSPTILNIPPATTTTTTKKKNKNNNNNNNRNKNDLSSLSKLPWCAAGDITGREAKEIKDQGFWALASAVYPEMKNGNCPDACDSPHHLAKEKDVPTCMPEDTLQGICAFNDVASTKNGDLIGAYDTPEPTVKELAWVERDCRYRLGDGELFQQCFKDKNFDLLYTEAPFTYEFYDRWKFGQNNNMEAGNVSPKGLRKQWENRTNNNEGKPIKAVVAIHLWPKMKDILYKTHKFEVENFVGPVNGQIKEWKDAMESEEGWLSKDSVFIVALASALHVQAGAPHYTHEAAEYYNEIARKLYGDAGWYVLDTMAISRARADHRMISEWYGGGGGKEGACEKWKCSGSGVLFAMTNVMYNIICT